MHRISSYSILIILILFSIVIGVKRVTSGFALSGDTGQIYIILQNIHDGLGPHNQILPSLMDLFFNKQLLTMSIEEFCKNDLISGPYSKSEYNHFQLHTYFIMYVMSLFVLFFEVPYVINVINTLAFILFIYFCYKYASKNIKWYYGVIIICLVSLHPAWSWSFIGQPYIDKIFLPFGLILIHKCETDFNSNKKILFLTIICCLIVEKVLIYVGIYLFITTIFNFKKFTNINVLLNRLLLSFIVILAFYFGIKLFLVNPYYGSSINLDPIAIFKLLQDERFLNGIISLLIISTPLLIPSLIFYKKLFIISLVMLLPNLIGNIGGAEKVGFFTHYHTLYFPFLVYGFIVSCNKFFLRYGSNKLFKLCGFSYLAFTSVFYIYIGFNSNLEIKFVPIKESEIFLNHLNTIRIMPNEHKVISKIIEQSIPTDARVSAIEPAWKYLYKYKNLVTYPFNIQSSDYLILSYEKKGTYSYFGFISYLGEGVSNKANECLMNQIILNNFDIENPIILNSSMAILRRK
jgi:hypothetical protein